MVKVKKQSKPFDLSTRAILVDLDVTAWWARRTDDDISTEVAKSHKAESKAAGVYSKRLLPPNSALSEIERCIGRARALHRELTLPWADGGMRIISTAGYMKYMDQLREQVEEFDTAVHTFVSSYPELQQKAKKFLGSMYRGEDYPEVASIKGWYSMRVKAFPVPAASDFRVKLSDQQVGQLRKQLESDVRSSLDKAMQDLWQRLYDMTGKFTTRLAKSDAVLRDSLLGNLKELCEQIPVLNLTEDKRLEQVRKQVLDKLGKYQMDNLREDDVLRKQVAKEAEAIHKSMAAYMEVTNG